MDRPSRASRTWSTAAGVQMAHTPCQIPTEAYSEAYSEADKEADKEAYGEAPKKSHFLLENQQCFDSPDHARSDLVEEH